MSCDNQGHVGANDGPNNELRCIYCGHWADIHGYWPEQQLTEEELMDTVNELITERVIGNITPPTFLTTPLAETPAEELRAAAKLVKDQADAEPGEHPADDEMLRYMTASLNDLADYVDSVSPRWLADNDSLMGVLTSNILLARSIVASVTAEVPETESDTTA